MSLPVARERGLEDTPDEPLIHAFEGIVLVPSVAHASRLLLQRLADGEQLLPF